MKSVGVVVFQVKDELVCEKLTACINNFSTLINITKNLEPGIQKSLRNIGDSIMASLDNLVGVGSKYLIKFVSSIAKAVPSTFINILIMIISTFFFVLDYERMRDFIKKSASRKVKDGAKTLRAYVTSTLFVVVRSYVLIMLLTFTELSILFLI